MLNEFIRMYIHVVVDRNHIIQLCILPQFTEAVFTGRNCPQGSSTCIVFTHGPIFRFFAPQGRHVAFQHFSISTRDCVGFVGRFRCGLQHFFDEERHFPVDRTDLKIVARWCYN